MLIPCFVQAASYEAQKKPVPSRETANRAVKDQAADNEKVTDQIKSCLVDLYIAQLKFFELNEKYSTSVSELRVSEIEPCQGVQVSFEVPTTDAFTLVGQLQGESWSLDESKSLTQVR